MEAMIALTFAVAYGFLLHVIMLVIAGRWIVITKLLLEH
jgi:hypothetical protein